MTENELGRTLLNLDMAPPPAVLDPRQLTRKILDRDRRRMRMLTWVATSFWILATGGFFWLIAFYILYITPRLKAYAAGRAHLENDWNDWALAGDIGARSILGCMIALLLAAVCTVMLIVQSRRATLRQINANLAVISQKLNVLRQPLSSEPPPPNV